MMKISPAKKISGTLHVPGDKSISHRVLILASLAKGESFFSGLSTGADVQSTARILLRLGTKIEMDGENIIVTGKGRFAYREPKSILDCGNSGTSARLLTGVIAGQKCFAVLSGDESLRSRPMKRVITPLSKMGARIWGRKKNSLLPLAILGTSLQGIEYPTPTASAQVKTAILLAGLLAEGETTVTEPALSRDHTERLFNWLGLPFIKEGRTYKIKPSGIPAFSIAVPGDFSSAAYFIALGVLHKNSRLTVKSVNLNPTRTGILQVLQRMGAAIRVEITAEKPEPVGDVFVEPSELQNVELTAAEIPSLIDELPLLAVVGTQAQGVMRVTGAKELRVKESDRITGIVSQLKKMGAKIEELPDGFIVEGPVNLRGAAFSSNSDHRIAMSLTVAAHLAKGESQLFGEKWVNISFPEFYRLLSQIVEA